MNGGLGVGGLGVTVGGTGVGVGGTDGELPLALGLGHGAPCGCPAHGAGCGGGAACSWIQVCMPVVSGCGSCAIGLLAISQVM